MASTTATTAGARGRGRTYLLVAVLFGLLAAVLVFVFLRSLQTQQKGTSVAVPVMSVVVAAQDVPARTRIDAGMLKLQQMPRSLALAGAYPAVSQVAGQVTRVPLAKGEQITAEKVAASIRDLTFAAAVPEGMRAVAISVSQVVGVGGLLVPGDYVDVIGLFPVLDATAPGGLVGKNGSGGSQQAQRYVSAAILQNVEVLAVAQEVPGSVQAPVAGGQTGGAAKTVSGGAPSKAQPDAKTVTLAVRPEDAEKLFMADTLGTLRLALRSVGDSTVAPVATVTNTLGDALGQSK